MQLRVVRAFWVVAVVASFAVMVFYGESYNTTIAQMRVFSPHACKMRPDAFTTVAVKGAKKCVGTADGAQWKRVSNRVQFAVLICAFAVFAPPLMLAVLRKLRPRRRRRRADGPV